MAGKYKPILVLDAYKLSRLGMTDTDIAVHFKVARMNFIRWQKTYPELKEALDRGRAEREQEDSLPDWVYSRLSPELKEVWSKISRWQKEKNGVVKIELILSEQGKLVRQQLFLYALCVSHFSPSLALQKVNVTRSELDRWINTDPDFAKLVTEIEWHKGNFFESQLVRLVGEGNPAAVIFANKTFNRGRGYASHTSVDVNVQGQVGVGVLDLTELLQYLGEGARAELLAAIRQKEQAEAEQYRTQTPLSVSEMVQEQVRGSVTD